MLARGPDVCPLVVVFALDFFWGGLSSPCPAGGGRIVFKLGCLFFFVVIRSRRRVPTPVLSWVEPKSCLMFVLVFWWWW